MHQSEMSFSRRQFLGYGAVASLGSVLAGSQGASAAEPATSPPAGSPKAVPSKSNPALPLVRRLADRFLSWQIDLGRLDPDHTSLATWTHARCSYPCTTIILNKLYHVTGEVAYRQAADRFALFFIAALCDGWKWHPPHFGLGLVMYHQLKQNYPKSPDLDPKAAALFRWLADWRWDEGSYYRNGYPGGSMPDAGNSHDNCETGKGLMFYYNVKPRDEVLATAEALAKYYVTEVKPGTYQGVWSSKLGTWVVAPTDESRIEHFEGVRVSDLAWAYTSINTIHYLTLLADATKNEALRAGIAPRCAASMKWQFDACQFDDGACGLSGRDDRWLGTTGGAILSYLRAREAGFLSEKDIATYRAKAEAARDWLVATVPKTDLDSPSAGYFRVHGTSLPKPPDCVAWMLAWAMEGLLHIEEI